MVVLLHKVVSEGFCLYSLLYSTEQSRIGSDSIHAWPMLFFFLKVKLHLPSSCPHQQSSAQVPSHFSSPVSPLPRWLSRLQVCPSVQHSHPSALLGPPKRTLIGCILEPVALWRDPLLSLRKAPVGFQLVQVLPMPDLHPQPSSLPRSIPAFLLVPEVLQSPSLLLFHTHMSTSPLPLAIQPRCLGHHLDSLFITLTSYLDLTTSHQGKWIVYFLFPKNSYREWILTSEVLFFFPLRKELPQFCLGSYLD